MTRSAESRNVATASGDRLSSEELTLLLNALWVWRGQLGRVGSEQTIPGLATAEARKSVDEVARKLGGDPDAYAYGAVSVHLFRRPRKSNSQSG